MLFTQTISSLDFKTWLWKNDENIRLLKLSALIVAISFVWLKIIYPYPNFMPPDSNSYIEAASRNQFINLWAIGYSKFLRLVSSFTTSHFALVLLQYVILQTSVLYFMFTMRYLVSPGKWAFRVLFAISIANPLLIHIANFVSTDALFATLSLIWFTQLLWIIYQPTKKVLFWHAVVVLLAFTVRYTAIYYPFLSIITILACPANRRQKYYGLGLVALMVGAYLARTAYEYKIKTNTIQYSAFGGWQIASNALYGYAHAKPIPLEKVSIKLRSLHAIVNQHMESLNRMPPFLRPDNDVAVYYLWDFKSPLRIYMDKLYPKTSEEEFFYKWATLAPLYADYGSFLIKKYPAEYIQYYLWPNFLKYYAPPTQFMGVYNIQNETVDSIIVKWFGWKNNKLPSLFNNREIQATAPFPILFATINIVFVLGFVSFTVLRGFKNCRSFHKRILWTVLAVWFVNMAFSVFVAPIELRYQIFPMVFTLGFTWVLMSYTIIKAKNESNKGLVSQPIITESIV